MKRIIRLCQSVIRGTEDPHPGMIDHTCVKSPVNQQPQFPQPLLPPPQKQDRSRIQISHSQQSFPPQPLFLLPRSPQLLLPQPLPQPPPQNSKRMIQMQLLSKPHPQLPPHPQLFPHPLCPPQQQRRIRIQRMLLLLPHPHPQAVLLVSHPHPQFVAAKSLMF